MGSQLVGRAFAFAVKHPLKPGEFRLLAFMAQTALDTDAEPRYFGSREMSAYGLGYSLPPLPAPGAPDYRATELVRESAFELVRRATKGLRESGAIRQLKRGRTGQRAEFALTLDTVRFAPSPGAEGEQFSPNKSLGLEDEHANVPPTNRWGSAPTDRWATSPNKSLGSAPTNRWAQGTTEEPLEELLEEPRLESGTGGPLQTGRADRVEPQREADTALGVIFPVLDTAKKRQPRTVAMQVGDQAGNQGSVSLNRYGECTRHPNYPAPCDACKRDATEAA